MFGLLSLVVVWIVAAPLDAQVADSVKRRDECRLAAQVLTHGQPANKRDWAYSYIDLCGPTGGKVLAELIRRHRLVDEPGGIWSGW